MNFIKKFFNQATQEKDLNSMALENDGVIEFTIGEQVKVARGKYQGFYGELTECKGGFCNIRVSQDTQIHDVLISDLEV